MPSVSGNVGPVFNGGTITSPLFLESPASSASETQLVDITNGNAQDLLYVDSAGNFFFAADGSQGAQIALASLTAILLQVIATSGVVQITQSATLVILRTTAPDDALLAAGQMALWFDPTNGAAKLMVKAKQADGTVRTGSLALA